jgi:hypothetical protein
MAGTPAMGKFMLCAAVNGGVTRKSSGGLSKWSYGGTREIPWNVFQEFSGSELK